MDTMLNLVEHPGFVASVTKYTLHNILNTGAVTEESPWEDVALFLIRNSMVSENPILIPAPIADMMNEELRCEAMERLFLPAMAAVPPTIGMSLESHLEKFLGELLSNFRKVDGADMLLSNLQIPDGLDFQGLLDQFVAH